MMGRSSSRRCLMSLSALLLVVGSALVADAHRQLLSSSSSSSSAAAAVVTRPAFVLTSSSSSEGSSASSETPLDTVLTFTASLPAPSRRLLTRPDNTCGTGALAKDKELAAIVEWMGQLAELLGVRHVDITAQGLAVTEGNTLSFTVYVLHAAGDFSTFSAQTLAGAPVSAGVLVPLAYLVDGLTFHRGDEVVLEDNLQQNPPSAAPTVIVECEQVLAFAGGIAPDRKRRHLLVPITPTPTTSLIDQVLTEITTGLELLANALGVDSSQVTAMSLDTRGDDGTPTFLIFVRVSESNLNAVKEQFMDNGTPQLFGSIVVASGFVIEISAEDAPSFVATLESNLLASAPNSVLTQFLARFLDPTTTPPSATTTAAATTTTAASPTTTAAATTTAP